MAVSQNSSKMRPLGNIRRLICIAAATSFFAVLQAQSELDAMRFSSNGIGGTARSMAMGGAFSAVGADFASSRLNPAGLGLYRKGDFMMTMRFDVVNSDLTYAGETTSDLTSGFAFSNIGYVFSGNLRADPDDAGPGLKSYAISLGYTQTDNYKEIQSASVFNDRSSISEFFADQAQGYSSVQLNGNNNYAGLGYSAFLINEDVPGTWKPSVPGGNVHQTMNVTNSGRRNEWNAGLAGNFEDFLYLGIGLGIESLKYSYELSYNEVDVNNLHQKDVLPDSTAFSELSFYDYHLTKGSGLCARIGVIVRPVDMFRVGLNLQAPTIFSLDDTYYSDVTAKFDNDPLTYGINADDNQEGIYSYKLSTPFKAGAGAMALFKKYGFLTADFEFIDYSASRFAGDNSPNSGIADFTEQNQAIRDLFNTSYNIRFGGELRYSALRFRLGIANHASVLKKDALSYLDYNTGAAMSISGNRRFYTGGFGIRGDSYYLDFAYVREVSENRQLFYNTDDPALTEPELITKKLFNSALLTIGFTF